MLFSAVLIGSGIGLSLGVAYLAGGMARYAAEHASVERVALVAADGYWESALAQQAEEMVPAVERLADEFAAGSVPDMATRVKTTRAADHMASELDCLAKTVYYEARGEGSEGQYAVAQVVMNRVKHRAFPGTVCGVVFQGSERHRGCQFSFTCNGSMSARLDIGAWKRARTVASQVFSGASVVEVASATHFHTTAVSPAWCPQMRQVAQVGTHVFYRFGLRKALLETPAAVVERVVMIETPAIIVQESSISETMPAPPSIAPEASGSPSPPFPQQGRARNPLSLGLPPSPAI